MRHVVVMQQIQLQRLDVLFRRAGFEADVVVYSDVVDEDIEPAKFADRLLDDGGAVFGRNDVRDDEAAFRAGVGARWTFLSDAGRQYVEALDLLETTDTLHRPYAPAVFTLYPDLTIHAAYNGYWFWGRPTLEELRLDFRHITRTIRPDWQVPR